MQIRIGVSFSEYLTEERGSFSTHRFDSNPDQLMNFLNSRFLFALIDLLSAETVKNNYE
jgi:hypothetical protein